MVTGRYWIEFEKTHIASLAMAIFEIPVRRITAKHNLPDQTTLADPGLAHRMGFLE